MDIALGLQVDQAEELRVINRSQIESQSASSNQRH